VAPRLWERGVRVNLVFPAFTDTPMLSARTRAELAAQGFRVLSPERVAKTVCLPPARRRPARRGS